MGLIGLGISVVAAFFLLIGLVPCLGWWNWITTLPIAVAGATVSSLAVLRSRSGLGIAGLVISLVVVVIAMGRLAIGCGIF